MIEEYGIFNNYQKFIVLDIEGYQKFKPYNIGYMITDRHGNIYKKVSLALLSNMVENFNNAIVTNICKEMTSKNVLEILSDENYKYTYINNENFVKMFKEDVQKYQISKVWAYNVNFDKGGLLAIDESLCDSLEFCDIISAILPRLLTKRYIKFCEKNGFLTKKGNYRYSAEIVYRYLTNDLNFVEAHTGLEDVQIEYQILLSALKSGYKIESKPQGPIWKKFKNFVKGE